MSDEIDSPTPLRTRGPGYPALDLETTLERAEQLAKLAPRHAVPLKAAAEAWGYSPRSSNNPKAAAALKRFGIVDDVGDANSRQLKLTEFGRKLLFHAQERDSEDWKRLVQEAALKPKIHREVLDHYDGALPADRVVEHYLIFQRGFNEPAARDFLRKLRLTLSFAGVSQTASASTPPEEAQASHNSHASGASAHAFGGGVAEKVISVTPYGGSPEGTPVDGPHGDQRGRRAIQVPYSTGEWATLEAAFPLSDTEWQSMIAVLDAMKPGLVKAPESE